MGALEHLMAHARQRPTELKKMKQGGTKIVGYSANGYMPEPLVYACGAMPVALIRGGDHEAVVAAGPYLARFIDVFCRAQIGYRMLGEEALYQMVDLVVIPVADNHARAIAESWEMWTDVDVFKLGVPSNKTKHGFDYYLDALGRLRGKLEGLTGIKLSEPRLRAEIDIANRMSELLNEISLMRKQECPPISGKDFIMLNHASFFADRLTLLKALEAISQELKTTEAPRPEGPRVMLIGSTLAAGDYKVIDLLEETGAVIVFEDFAEGMRHYSQKIDVNGNLMDALAQRYFMKEFPPAYAKPAIRERFDFFINQAKEFNVAGIVWYSLMYRDCYDMEGFLFQELARDRAGIPVLKLQSDYDAGEREALRTRIETFVEMITKKE